MSFTQIKSSDDNKNVKRRSAIETMISNGLSFFLLACLAGVYAYFYFKPPIPQKVNEIDINKGNIDEGLNDIQKKNKLTEYIALANEKKHINIEIIKK